MRHNQNLLPPIVTLLFAFFYFSYSSYAQRLPEEPLRFHKDYTENGLIFGSITFPNDQMRFDNYDIKVNYTSSDKKLHRKNSYSIRIIPTMFISKHYGELNSGKTYLFAMEKPPGEYTISFIQLSTQKIGQYVPSETIISGFLIPFTVNKGEITYIGEIYINEYAYKKQQIVSLNDNFDRDKNYMKNKYNMVNWDSALKSKLEFIHSDDTEKK